MKILLGLLFALCIAYYSFGQNVYVPDNSFEVYLEQGSFNDDDSVSQFLISNLFNLSIDGNSYPVADWTGLESATSLSLMTLTNMPSGLLDLSSYDLSSVILNIGSCLYDEIYLGDIGQTIISSNPLLQSLMVSGEITGVQFQIQGNSSLSQIDFSTATVGAGCNLITQGNNNLSYMNLKNGYCLYWSSVAILLNPVLFCIQVDDPIYCEVSTTWNWSEFDFWDGNNPGVPNPHSYSNSCSLSIEQIELAEKQELIRIVNLLGQEVEYTPNTVLIYQYADGTSEKVFTIED